MSYLRMGKNMLNTHKNTQESFISKIDLYVENSTDFRRIVLQLWLEIMRPRNVHYYYYYYYFTSKHISHWLQNIISHIILSRECMMNTKTKQ